VVHRVLAEKLVHQATQVRLGLAIVVRWGLAPSKREMPDADRSVAGEFFHGTYCQCISQ
jgi:hypothetical protein